MVIDKPTTELRVGDRIYTGDGKRSVEVKKVQWSRRKEWCVVNNSMVYSYGGYYQAVV